MGIFKDYMSICASAPSELLATVALRNLGTIRSNTRSICEANLPLVRALFQKWSSRFEWIEPYGGSTVFPRLKEVDSCTPFVDRLVKEFGILVLAGEWMSEIKDTRFRAHFRVGLGRKNIPEILEKLDEAFEKMFGTEE